MGNLKNSFGGTITTPMMKTGLSKILNLRITFNLITKLYLLTEIIQLVDSTDRQTDREIGI